MMALRRGGSSIIAAIVLAAATAQAQVAYPNRAIRYVVASAPGGIADTSARVLGPSLGKALGQPVVVENRTAGGILVGADLVAKATPDGHTLLSVTPQLAIAPSMHRQLPF